MDEQRIATSNEAAVERAIALLRGTANLIRECHTEPPAHTEWGDEHEAKADHDEQMAAADALEKSFFARSETAATDQLPLGSPSATERIEACIAMIRRVIEKGGVSENVAGDLVFVCVSLAKAVPSHVGTPGPCPFCGVQFTQVSGVGCEQPHLHVVPSSIGPISDRQIEEALLVAQKWSAKERAVWPHDQEPPPLVAATNIAIGFAQALLARSAIGESIAWKPTALNERAFNQPPKSYVERDDDGVRVFAKNASGQWFKAELPALPSGASDGNTTHG